MDTLITLCIGVTMGMGLVTLGLGVFVIGPAPARHGGSEMLERRRHAKVRGGGH